MHRHKKDSILLLYFALVMITPCKALLSRINDQATSYLVPIGGAVDFDCRLSDPNAQVELYHVKKYVATDGVKVSEVGQIFTVYNISRADKGDYTCKSPLSDGTKQLFPVGSITALNFGSLKLQLNVSPKIIRATEGESAMFTCEASSSKPARVTWYKDKEELTYQNKSRVGNVYTSVLHVTDLDVTDNGDYECRVQVQIYNFPFGKLGFFPAQVELIVQDFKFVSKGHTVFVGNVGSSFTINCNTTDPSATTSLWIERSHQTIHQVTPDGLRILQNGPVFVIHRVTIKDGGKYVCKAVSTYGKTISMEMGRFIPLQGGYRDPKAYISPQTKNLNLDKDFNFTCQAFGDSINFTWYKDGAVVPPDMVTIFPRRLYKGYTMFESILTIRNAERSDEGRFTCQITNSLQPGYTHSATANLTIYECPKANGKFRDPFNSTLYIECVNGTGTRQQCPLPGQYWDDSDKDCLFPPSIPTTPFLNWISDRDVNRFVVPKSSYRFDCRLTDPSIPVQLKKKGIPVTVDGTKVMLDGQEFIMSKLETGDSGQYSCHAKGFDNSKIIQIYVDSRSSLELSVRVIGGTNRIELETTFNKTLICTSFYAGEMYWYKVDPKTNGLTLITGESNNRWKNGYLVTTTSLVLLDVTLKDAGMYMCRKNNSYNAVANTTVEIIVKTPFKPTVSTSLARTIKEHKSLQLRVAVSGSPFPDVTWHKGQQALVTCRGGQRFTCTSHQNNYEIGDSIDVLNRDPTSYLLFKIIDPSHPVDSGVHLIKVKNIIGKDQTQLNLSVIVRPRIKENKNVVTQFLPNESRAKLVCEVMRAEPSPTITWKYQVMSCSDSINCKPNPSKWQSITSSVARVEMTTSMKSVLHVFPTDMLIYYRCSVKNTAGYSKKEFVLYRKSNFGVDLEIEGEKTKYKNEHENITMICRALKSFVGPPSWRDYENRLITNSSRVRILVTEDSFHFMTLLQLFGAQINDSGNYVCQAINNDGKIQNKSTNLKVFALSQPSVSIVRNLTVNETNHVTLPCRVSGHPLPVVEWLKDGRLLKPKILSSSSQCSSRLNGFYQLNSRPLNMGKPQKRALIICNVKSDNTGWYKCKAKNMLGSAEGEAYLNVQAPPTVILTDEHLPRTVRIGDSVVIHCHATGNPTPHVRWLKQSENNDSFVAFGNVSTWASGNSTLSLSILKREDYAKYRCIATNKLGDKWEDRYIFKPEILHTFRGRETVSKSALIAIVVSGSLVILLLLVIIAVLYRRKKLYGGFYILTLPPMPDYIRKLDPSRSLQEQTHKLPLCADWEFPRNRLTLGKVIGSGAFGQVFVADAVGIVAFDPRSSMKGKGSRRRSRFGSTRSPYYNNKQVTTVACKGLKEDATESEYKDLVSELKILMHIGEHKNIVNLLGACTKGRQCDLLVVIEYCPHGNLLEFLRKRRELFEPEWAPPTEKAEERFSTTDLVITAFQVARAMEFLASRRCVHRDLAARNVLVGEDYVMKVADFGLARDIYKDEHYVKTTAGLLPVKWMAIEALVDRIYTHQSDVWSFGVLLWEIFTLGGSPYPGLPANEVYQYLMEGQRMEQPHDCPVEIYALMLGCWEHDPSQRPAFSAILQAIDKLLQEKTTQTGEEYLELENEQDVNENQPYYLEPEDLHPVSPVFDSPQGSPLPPIPAEEIELEYLIKKKDDQDYLNRKEFDFCDLPRNRTRKQGPEFEMEKARTDSMEKENGTKSESSGNHSDEEDYISEKEHLMKNYEDEKDVCERDSGLFETPPAYINTRPYANVSNFIKNYGSNGAASKDDDGFRPRQQSARYV